LNKVKLICLQSWRGLSASIWTRARAGPAFVVIKAANEFKDKTTAPNQMWQTDFTYLKVIGWGWFYLSTILSECLP
jgi:transposase InsO family protein